jgi:hypothetical protein
MATATATQDQITQLRRHAVNTVTREIMANGIKLTWEQADDLGDEVIDWMGKRLGLKSRTTDAGIIFSPTRTSGYHAEGPALYGRGRYYIRIKTAPSQQWEQPAGWNWDDLDEAKIGAAKAAELWMAVELMDSETGKKVRWG